MFEDMIQQLLPQLAKILAFFILFIVGYKVINFTGGIPTRGGKIVSKIKSLIIIGVGGACTLFILEPILEAMILSLLNQFVEFAVPIAFLLAGFALLKFNEKMRWDYSKFGYACIAIGILLLFYILCVS